MGKSLNGAVDNYNKTIGTFERRVLSTARKFENLGATLGDAKITDLEAIDVQTRTLQNLPTSEDEITVE
jgi:DNA recombination protein RmuC